MANFAALKNLALAKQRAAAQIIATAAGVSASAYSRRIPRSMRVLQTGAQRFSVVAGGDAAPNARPFETGDRHPLWGRWVTGKGRQPKRPFLEEGAAAGITEAASVFATFIDDVCDVLDLDCE